LVRLKGVRRDCFDDPLEVSGLSYLSNFLIGMKMALGAMPGVLQLVAHAVVPGVFPHATESFRYSYVDSKKES